MIKSALAALAAALFIPLASPAQDLSPEEARADLAALYQGLQEAHYDLYALTPRAVFYDHYAALTARLNHPVSRSAIYAEFQRFTALSHFAHARLEGLNPGFHAHLQENGLVFPLDLRIKDGAVIIVGAPEGIGVEVGEEILALNGEPNAIWLARLTRNISAETPLLAYSQLERMPAYFIWLEHPDAETFHLRVEGVQGARDVTLPAVSYDIYAATPNMANASSLDGREAAMLSSDIAYLRPGPFYNVDAQSPADAYDPEATRRFIAFIDEAFVGFIENGAEALILDLRNNPGGDSSYSDPVVAWFADAPFRFYSEFRLKVSAQTTASNAARLEGRSAQEAGVSGVYAQLFAAHEDGDVVLFETDYVQPRAQRFDGRVYVLIDRTSYSNAASTAALIQDYGFGVIVGETTTDMATIMGAMEHFTLPYSGFQIGYPKAHIIRPNGEERFHPVTPDIEVDAPVLDGDRDAMLAALVALIEGAQIDPI